MKKILKHIHNGYLFWIISTLGTLCYFAFLHCVFMNVYFFYNEGLKIKEKYLRSGKWNKEAVDFPEHWKVYEQMVCEITVLKCVRFILKFVSKILIKSWWSIWVILSKEFLSKGGEWISGDKNRLMENSSWGFVFFFSGFVLFYFKIFLIIYRYGNISSCD